MTYNITKGFQNLLIPNSKNFILAGCLIIIFTLIYLQTKQLDLFTSTDDYLTSFINKYVKNIQQKNEYLKTLATQEQTIQQLSKQVTNIINPST